jgi:hypothetical protein
VNDGMLFYWFMWMGWVYTTFIMKKDGERTRKGFFLLSCICLSSLTIPFSTGTINAASLLFAAAGFIYLGRTKGRLLYYITVCFIAATAYVSVELFSLYDPVKILIDKKYLLGVILLIVLICLSKKSEDVIFLHMIGLFLGDVLYQLVIYRLQGYVEIGSLYMLDLFALTSMILIFMVKLVDMFKKMKNSSIKKINHLKQI